MPTFERTSLRDSRANDSGLQPPRAREPLWATRILRARSGRLQALVGALSERDCFLIGYESRNRRNQTPWYNHNGLTAGAECRFILGNGFVVSLLLVML